MNRLNQNSKKQSGGTLLGFVVGLTTGLLIAVGIALFIKKIPAPFVNKVLPMLEHKEPALAKLPDPNQALYTKDGLQASEPNSAAQPAPGQVNGHAASLAVTPNVIADHQPMFLQIGAYKTRDDAESMKAKIALLGFEAKIITVEKEGGLLYRVRLGPYDRIDDLNQVRQRLVENNIDSASIGTGK